MHSLLAPGGKLAGLLFCVVFDKQGPPYGGSELEYRAVFEDYFGFRHFAPCYNSIPARKGNELFMLLQRK